MYLDIYTPSCAYIHKVATLFSEEGLTKVVNIEVQSYYKGASLRSQIYII